MQHMKVKKLKTKYKLDIDITYIDLRKIQFFDKTIFLGISYKRDQKLKEYLKLIHKNNNYIYSYYRAKKLNRARYTF